MTDEGRPAPGAASRGLATRAVAAVLGSGRTLDEALAGLDLGGLAGSDRAQVRALAFGALRWHHRHRFLLGELLDRPLDARDRLLESLLSVGLFQLLDGGQPEYAAVSATVAAARWLGRPRLGAVVNATLRRLQRERDALLTRAMADEQARYSHPAWLIRRVRDDWPGDWANVLEADQARAPLWLRINRLRQSAAAYEARVQRAGLGCVAGATAGALRLARPLPVTELPGFDAGEVSVQDAASQVAAVLLAPEPGLRVLDACAAPGGKTTHLLELAAGRLDLLALDIDPRRLVRLDENLVRLGLVATTRAADATDPASWWDGQPFDRILVDAPCSGTGVLRRHPDAKWLRRESDLEPLARRQRDLLARLWPLLRPGGLLLYATCSILRQENQDVTAAFLAGEPGAAPAGATPAALPPWLRPAGAGAWQVLPGDADTDGLYYALMTRRP